MAPSLNAKCKFLQSISVNMRATSIYLLI